MVIAAAGHSSSSGNCTVSLRTDLVCVHLASSPGPLFKVFYSIVNIKDLDMSVLCSFPFSSPAFLY